MQSSITELGVVETPVLMPANVLPHLLSPLSPFPDHTPVQPTLDFLDTPREQVLDSSGQILSTLPTPDVVAVTTDADTDDIAVVTNSEGADIEPNEFNSSNF